MAKSAKNIYRVTDLADNGIDPLAYRLLCFGVRYRSEMDFSWEALEGAQARLTTVRQRMVDWASDAGGSGSRTAAVEELDRRFRDAIADDLDLPHALVILNELVSDPEIPGREKHEQIRSWDAVLGLDLDRLVREGSELPPEVLDLVRRRDAARDAKDYAASDAIRDRLTAMGYEVMDTPDGTKVRRRA